MKKYKVGDTIYIKDTVTDIDCDDSTATYNGNHHGWLDNSCIIDELPAEPVKPVLPKDVADELEIAKKSNVSFDVYIMKIIYGYPEHKKSRAFWNDSSDGTIKTLMDAWNNGYTVKKEPANLVYVPGTNKKFVYNKRGDTATRMAKLETPVVPSPVTSYETAYDQYKPLYEFTDVEITKFGLQDCEKEGVK